SSQTHFADLVDSCMSTQLRRDRPLWQICVAERLDDGTIGIVGKAHHCMVDGIAAVELASLLLDPTPHPPPEESDGWLPRRSPGSARRLLGGLLDLVAGGCAASALFWWGGCFRFAPPRRGSSARQGVWASWRSRWVAPGRRWQSR